MVNFIVREMRRVSVSESESGMIQFASLICHVNFLLICTPQEGAHVLIIALPPSPIIGFKSLCLFG